MKQAIVFDLDDTLYPEKEFVLSGYKAVAAAFREQHGIEIFDDLWSRFEKGERGDLFTPAVRQYLPGVAEEDIRHLVRVYREHEPMIHPFPESEEVIRSLKTRFLIGLLSDGHLEVQKRKFRALGLASYFDAVVFSDEWGKEYWKPHPKPYQECARRLSVPCRSLTYVADNPEKDFIGARSLGVRTVRLRKPDTLHCELALSSDYEADQETTSLRDLVRIL